MREVNNQDDLANVLKSFEKVFVLFYTTWCPYCKSFLSIFEKYAKIEEKKRQDKFLRVKIDGEMNPLWEKYDVKVVPTIIFFEGANVLRRLDGVIGLGGSEKQFKEFLDTCSV